MADIHQFVGKELRFYACLGDARNAISRAMQPLPNAKYSQSEKSQQHDVVLFEVTLKELPETSVAPETLKSLCLACVILFAMLVI
jgi:hypothetical protein